jgi:hypothetical protein
MVSFRNNRVIIMNDAIVPNIPRELILIKLQGGANLFGNVIVSLLITEVKLQ